jgi:hypothetical protein
MTAPTAGWTCHQLLCGGTLGASYGSFSSDREKENDEKEHADRTGDSLSEV